MITTLYVRVWMTAKKATWRLRHPVLTSEHLLYACLRLHDQRHWSLCRDLPVTAENVWSHLQQNQPLVEASEDFYGVSIRVSSKVGLEGAESEAAHRGHSYTGTERLIISLLSESEGPVRSLLDACKVGASRASHEPPK